MGLSIVSWIRSRRAVSNGGLLLSVAYDLPCFKRFSECYQLCSDNAWIRLSIVPSIISHRTVSNGGLLLSVAYDLTCFMRFFQRYKRCLENAWMRLPILPLFRSRRAVSNGGLLLSVAFDLTCFMRFFERHKLCLENAWLAVWPNRTMHLTWDHLHAAGRCRGLFFVQVPGKRKLHSWNIDNNYGKGRTPHGSLDQALLN